MEKLRPNRADIAAAKQTGFPPVFYTIQRCFGNDTAIQYLRKHQKR